MGHITKTKYIAWISGRKCHVLMFCPVLLQLSSSPSLLIGWFLRFAGRCRWLLLMTCWVTQSLETAETSFMYHSLFLGPKSALIFVHLEEIETKWGKKCKTSEPIWPFIITTSLLLEPILALYSPISLTLNVRRVLIVWINLLNLL